MKIKVTHTYSFFSVHGLNRAQLKVIDSALSFTFRDAFFSEAYKRKVWDGKKHLLKKVKKNGELVGYKFPTGLLREARVIEALGHPQLEWHPGFSKCTFAMPDDIDIRRSLKGIELYDYQVFCVKKMLRKRRGVVQVATGGGKTEIAASVILLLNKITVVLVPTLDLLYQTRERYAKRLGYALDDVGIVGEGLYHVRDITVASVPTLRLMINRRGSPVDDRARDFFERVEVLICDETHMISDNTFFGVFMAFTNAEFRYGMSATPFDREDNTDLMLIGATSTTIARVTPSYLMKNGYLAVPVVNMLKIDSPSMSSVVTYQQALQHGIIDNPVRNDAIVRLVHRHAGSKILVIFRYLRHGSTISRLLYDLGIRHTVVKGDVPGEEREAIRHEFEGGDLDVLVASSGVFKLGIDLPSIQILIRADGGKSKISTIQILGRALRREKTDRVIVYDFFDDTQKYLRQHSRKRLKDYRQLGDPVVVNQIDLTTGQQYLVI